jgi:pimeloyl-ACP methyl ester carboxylesterase
MTASTQNHPPTVVLMPGLLCDGAIWQAVQCRLQGLAPIWIADFSKTSSITDMAHSVLERNDGPLVAIGHSMGGRVALEMVRSAPERIAGLGLLDTGIHSRREGEEAKRAALVRLGYEQGMGALADIWLPPMVDPRRMHDADLLAPMKAMVLRASPEQHERQIRALLDRPDARGGLSGIRCPTLVMVGRQDQWSPLAQHEEIAALIPGAKLVVIEDSGHMLPMEQPEPTAAAIAAWLQTAVLGQ